MGIQIQRVQDRQLILGGLGAMRVRHGGGGAAPWWDPNSEGLSVWAAYQPKGAASLAASYMDLSGNGHDAGVGVAPTWDTVNGWKFNGTTQYLTTTFVPQNDQTQTVLVQFTNSSGLAKWILGVNNGAGRSLYIVSRSPANTVQYGNGGAISVAPYLLAGNLAVAGNTGYRDGVADAGAIPAWGGASTFPLWIGAANNTGNPTWYFGGYIQALAIYDTTLTAGQVAAIAAQMALL